jgi:hypothetical protein
VQIARADNVADVIARDGVKLVSEAKLAEFLRRLVVEPSLNRINDDAAHFSLGGVQPKKALLRVGADYDDDARAFRGIDARA